MCFMLLCWPAHQSIWTHEVCEKYNKNTSVNQWLMECWEDDDEQQSVTEEALSNYFPHTN